MILNIFIAIVFMAELVIACAIIINLIKLDKCIIKYNAFITDIQPKIKDIAELIRLLSEQAIEFANHYSDRIKLFFKNIVFNQMQNILSAITFWAVKSTIEKKV